MGRRVPGGIRTPGAAGGEAKISVANTETSPAGGVKGGTRNG